MGSRTTVNRILTAFLLVILLLSASACTNHPGKGETKAHLQVHFIDVGQGDSILIDLGTNLSWLVEQLLKMLRKPV